MFNEIKFFIQKILSAKPVKIGKCNKCGNCCRNIVFYINNKIVSEEQEFIDMKNFDKKYNNFEINGRGQNGELLFKCKSLSADGLCKSYKFRSLYCRLYPFVKNYFYYTGKSTISNCGYKIVASKKFSDYIN
jgi:hypothetical protein